MGVALLYLLALMSSLQFAAAGEASEVSPLDAARSIPGVGKTSAERCSVPLWSMDPDPAGLNVRSKARRRAPVQGTLPPETTVTVIDAKNGWFEFKDPLVWNWPEAERIPLKGGPKQGWVYGGLLGVDTTCRRGQKGEEVLTVYTRPDETSASVVTWVAGQDFACDWHIEKPLDCHGRWLKAVLTKGPGAKPISGWLHPENLCDNPLTTCSGY